MNPSEAHQIANPEIFTNLEYIKYCLNKNNCSFCEKIKEKLKGILIAQEKEYNFLEDLCWILQDVLAKETAKLINKRLEALKISNEDLRRVLK